MVAVVVRRAGYGWCLRAGALALVAVAACGSPQHAQAPAPVTLPVSCDLPQTVHLTIEASDRLNPDSLGRSLPTVVRVYQLKNLARLEQAEFADVWRRAHDTLADDIVGAEELVLQPHERVVRSFTRVPEAHYVVGVGIFRRPAGESWWTPFELPPPPAQARCAAQRRNPNALPDVPDPRFAFFLEDYRIEAGDDTPVDDDSGGGGLQLPDAGLTPPALPSAPAAPAIAPPAAPGLSLRGWRPFTPGASGFTQGNRAG